MRNDFNEKIRKYEIEKWNVGYKRYKKMYINVRRRQKKKEIE